MPEGSLNLRSLTIVQPYVPSYRVPFFEALTEVLREEGIRCTIAAPQVNGAQAKRGDSASHDWITPVRRREVSIGNRRIVLGGSYSSWKNADGVILGNRGSSADNYLALLEQRRRGLKVGLWGHIRDYVTPGHPVDRWLEGIQLARADHVFAYVPSGAKYAIDRGVGKDRVTVVMNSIDDLGLQRELRQVDAGSLTAFRSHHSLEGKRVFAFLGGLDGSKRIAFLVKSLERLRQLNPDFVLLVGGRGQDEALLDPYVASGNVIRLGYVNAHEKARVLKASEAILMPGRVGLVAVEALVSQRPILTTDWPFHAPEVEYLEAGVSIFKSLDAPLAYAEMVYGFESRLPEGSTWAAPSLSQMVENFANGVIEMFNRPAGSPAGEERR